MAAKYYQEVSDYSLRKLETKWIVLNRELLTIMLTLTTGSTTELSVCTSMISQKLRNASENVSPLINDICMGKLA
jgi:hypothetical protein